MARKAVLHFPQIDYEYQRMYGKMPDYDYTDRLKAGQSREEVKALVYGRMDRIWERMKEEHEKAIAEEQEALEKE